MAKQKTGSRVLSAAAIAVGLSTTSAPGAFASEWKFTLSGVFNGSTDNPVTSKGKPVISETITNGTGAGAPTLTANDPFTLTALFDSSSPNLIAGLQPPFLATGWVAYAPQWVTLSVDVGEQLALKEM